MAELSISTTNDYTLETCAGNCANHCIHNQRGSQRHQSLSLSLLPSSVRHFQNHARKPLSRMISASCRPSTKKPVVQKQCVSECRKLQTYPCCQEQCKTASLRTLGRPIPASTLLHSDATPCTKRWSKHQGVAPKPPQLPFPLSDTNSIERLETCVLIRRSFSDLPSLLTVCCFWEFTCWLLLTCRIWNVMIQVSMMIKTNPLVCSHFRIMKNTKIKLHKRKLQHSIPVHVQIHYGI